MLYPLQIVIYTASLSKYADPLLDKLDVNKVIDKRLFRENCVFHDGHFVKDLSLLNRELSQTIIVDNSPMSYKFHPENAIDCASFIGERDTHASHYDQLNFILFDTLPPSCCLLYQMTRGIQKCGKQPTFLLTLNQKMMFALSVTLGGNGVVRTPAPSLETYSIILGSVTTFPT